MDIPYIVSVQEKQGDKVVESALLYHIRVVSHQDHLLRKINLVE